MGVHGAGDSRWPRSVRRATTPWREVARRWRKVEIEVERGVDG